MTIRLADAECRQAIYRARHTVYAAELAQHSTNDEGRLSDALDAFNTYIVAESEGELIGFVSVTPPAGGTYSIDKYLSREVLPFSFDERLYEVRLLTVMPTHRRSAAAPLLMYAAFRWIESRGGTRIVAIGRREVLDLYRRVGLETLSRSFPSGAVTYEAMTASIERLRYLLDGDGSVLAHLERFVSWEMDVPFRPPTSCFHGGAFFDAIGEEFDTLEKRNTVINADVLDAWFAPCSRSLDALRENLDWVVRTSPPVDCGGLVRAIARARRIPAECILVGGGSSHLVFLAFRRWLGPASRVLTLDPTYGEYAHLLERVIGCRVERLRLDRDSGFAVDLEVLGSRIRDDFDLVVLVNPNSPTGRHIPREELQKVMRFVAPRTRIWIDETYVDFAGADQSLETFAAHSENVFVCKSMSKVYALSGVRVAYLCGPSPKLEELRVISPPWGVSLPGQIAAVEALRDPEYYAAKYAETRRLRERLAEILREELHLEIVPGTANFLLAHLPDSGPDAAEVVAACRRERLYLRDLSSIGPQVGRHALRIAVKDGSTNEQIVAILRSVLRRLSDQRLQRTPLRAPLSRKPLGAYRRKS